MNVRVNGERRELDEGTSVDEIVRGLTEAERGVAVAVDGEVIPRAEWAERRISEGERVEALSAMQGG